MSEQILFDGWTGIGRTVLVGLLGYAALIVLLRISGKRTLSKMNAFDLVVTVALGSTLATLLLSKEVALAEGLTAFAVLIGGQFVITWLSVRSGGFEKTVKSQPSLLFHQGRFLDRTLRAERVSRAEVLAAVRNQGVVNLESVEAVVLETDGSFATMSRPPEAAEPSSLQPFLRPDADKGEAPGTPRSV